MIFAAGFGTRMAPLTHDRPKPLIDVAGKPLIDHALALAEAIPDAKIVINLHYKAEMMRDHLRNRDVVTIIEAPDILETGGGLRHALDHLGSGPVLTLNPDVMWYGPNPLAALIDAWEPDRMDALLACIPQERVYGREGAGDFELDAHGRITRGTNWVYGGAQILKTDRLASVADKAFSLNIIWDQMAAEGRLFGFRYPGKWCDIGRPEGIGIAERLMEQTRV